eukprot:TRINITY_DN33028_c0_g1_i1.p2 TRINITY_DN33028_c0_g1~~TRINITY_DN33028_c0_g1_i1.p2  ORF type:complete len:109 (+),score=31.97 TRINITY_DN33028_c0_g1_i1:103-429(+)
MCLVSFFFFFKQKTAYEMLRSLVGSEMCIRDRVCPDTGSSRKDERDASASEQALRPSSTQTKGAAAQLRPYPIHAQPHPWWPWLGERREWGAAELCRRDSISLSLIHI